MYQYLPASRRSPTGRFFDNQKLSVKMRNKIIQIRTDEETKKGLEEASEKTNLQLATFVRVSAVQEAKKILEAQK